MLILDSLTELQLKVLKLVMRGFCNKEIAREIGVSLGYVKTQVTVLLKAYGVDSRSQLILKVAKIESFD